MEKSKIVADSAGSKNLLRVIPAGELQMILDQYYLEMSRIKGYKDAYKAAQNFPDKEIKSLRKILAQLTRKEWLTESGGRNIEAILKEAMRETHNGFNYMARNMLKKIFKTKGRNKEKPATDILIVVLIHLLLERTGKYHYVWVADFLMEQEIIDISIEGIKRRFDSGNEDIEKLIDVRCLVSFLDAFKEMENESPDEIIKEVTADIQKLLDNYPEELREPVVRFFLESTELLFE